MGELSYNTIKLFVKFIQLFLNIGLCCVMKSSMRKWEIVFSDEKLFSAEIQLNQKITEC